MASTRPRGHTTFPFFDLPRELRDLIYDETLETKTCELKRHLPLKAEEMPPINVLLVSKQAKQELEERAGKRSHLYIKDFAQFVDDKKGPTIALPIAATRIRKVTIEVTPDIPDQLVDTLMWVQHILPQIPDLRTLSVTVVTEVKTEVEAKAMDEGGSAYMYLTADSWAEELQKQGWTALPMLDALRVVDYGEDFIELYGTKTKLRVGAEWSKDLGSFEVLLELKEWVVEGP